MANNDTVFEATIFTNTSAPSTSYDYNVKGFNNICIIAKITLGQLDIQVSNDGSRFITYDSLTSDGYIELNGFSLIRMSVSSGIVISAVMVARRRYSIISMEISASKREYRHKRLDKIGWGKGDI